MCFYEILSLSGNMKTQKLQDIREIFDKSPQFYSLLEYLAKHGQLICLVIEFPQIRIEDNNCVKKLVVNDVSLNAKYYRLFDRLP